MSPPSECFVLQARQGRNKSVKFRPHMTARETTRGTPFPYVCHFSATGLMPRGKASEQFKQTSHMTQSCWATSFSAMWVSTSAQLSLFLLPHILSFFACLCSSQCALLGTRRYRGTNDHSNNLVMEKTCVCPCNFATPAGPGSSTAFFRLFSVTWTTSTLSSSTIQRRTSSLRFSSRISSRLLVF